MQRLYHLVKCPPELIEIVNHFRSSNAINSTNISNEIKSSRHEADTQRAIEKKKTNRFRFNQFKRCQLALLNPEKFRFKFHEENETMKWNTQFM